MTLPTQTTPNWTPIDLVHRLMRPLPRTHTLEHLVARLARASEAAKHLDYAARETWEQQVVMPLATRVSTLSTVRQLRRLGVRRWIAADDLVGLLQQVDERGLPLLVWHDVGSRTVSAMDGDGGMWRSRLPVIPPPRILRRVQLAKGMSPVWYVGYVYEPEWSPVPARDPIALARTTEGYYVLGTWAMSPREEYVMREFTRDITEA